MPNQFLSDEFGDIEDYFVTDYWLIDNFVGDTLWVWGQGDEGRLGTNGGLYYRATPVTTFAGGTNWKQVACGRFHTTAIKTDGTLWTWGRNGAGQLGDNTTTNRSTPVTTFAGGTNWKQVSAGVFYTAAIKTDGSLWLWGENNAAQLGNNVSGSDRSTPVTTFTGGNNWKSVDCGGYHTVAIKTDGSLWNWGRNNNGQLGDFSTTQRNIPVTTFAGGTTWKQVSAGQEVTFGIKTDGTLWSWGAGAGGRLGNFAVTDRSTPVTTFAGGTNWKQISCESDHTAAIKTDGSLWTWGLGSLGRLGTNDTITRSTPVTTFAGGNNWKSVVGARENTAALKTDGSLWVWGYSGDGTLGTNDTTNRSTPVTTFAGGNNWKQVSGGVHTAAIQSGLNVDLS
jgi:hypothetical protein